MSPQASKIHTDHHLVAMSPQNWKILRFLCINNKVLLYSTGNYIQHSVTNHNGKEYEKEYIHIYINIYN